jgi:mevalonate kinase
VFDVFTRVSILARPNAPTDDSLVVAPSIGLKANLTSLTNNHPIREAIRLVLVQLNVDHLPVCEIQIHSSIPPAAGLGSSASTSVALIRAISTFLGHPFSDEVNSQIAFEVEKIHHGNPSGIDNSVIAFEKAINFVKGTPIEFLEIKSPFTLVIADTGIKSSTGKVVSELRERYEANPSFYQPRMDRIGEITTEARKMLDTGDLPRLGKLLSENHQVLKEIGVSCNMLDHLVETALSQGALGAKLSGGGQGGNMLAIVRPEDADLLSGRLRAAGAVNTVITRVPFRVTP